MVGQRKRMGWEWAAEIIIMMGIVALVLAVLQSFSILPRVISEIKVTESLTHPLSFKISRWWDILFVPLFWLIPFFWLIEKKLNIEDARPNMNFGLIIGFLAGMSFLTLYSLGFSLLFCMVICGGVGFLFSFFIKLTNEGFGVALSFSLGYCVASDFGPGCYFGFIYVPIFVLSIGLICLTAVLLASLFRFFHWLGYRIRYGSDCSYYMPFAWRV